jgi:non-specific serine/threonine protein kinase
MPDNIGPGEELLSKLEHLPAGKIYVMAPRKEVLKAIALLRGTPLRDFTWSRDRSVLNLEVADPKLTEISLSIADGGLGHSCECGLPGGCQHLVCALITLKKLLSPHLFRDIHFSDEYLEELSAILTANGHKDSDPSSKLPFRLVVEQGDSGISMRAWIGNRIATRQDRGLTDGMRRFADGFLNPPFRERILEVFRELIGEDAQISYRKGDVEIPLTFSAERIRETRTLFALAAERVSVHKTLEDGIPLPDDSFATNRYFFHIPAGRIDCIASTAGWGLWEHVKNAVTDRHPGSPAGVERTSRRISMAIGEFRLLGLSLPEKEWNQLAPSALFSVNGAPVLPEERHFIPEIHISAIGKGGEDFSILCTMAGAGATYPLSNWPFGMLTEAERWRFSAPLRTKMRFGSAVTACFDLLSCNTLKEQDKLLRVALAGDNFLKRKVKNEAKHLAMAFAHGCEGRDPLLIADGGGWCLYSLERREQARLLEIPFRIFGPSAFSGSIHPGGMRVTRDDLMPRLPELQTQLAANGWRLLFDGRPVRTVRWEFTLDATRATIDWFELRPEVRCDGADVSARELAEALEGGGIYRKDGEFVMLDSETNTILSLLPKPAKGRGKGTAVRIPRLQILDWLYLRKSGVTVRLSAENERIFASLASFETIPQTPLPEGLNATLRHYQADGYNWLAFLYEHRFGACLADDMGLGKTIQAISLLAGLHEGKIASHAGERLPHLIVVPPTLLFNWESEIARFYPLLKVITYRGIDRSIDFSDADVVLTSYGIVQRDGEKLGQIRFHVIILDEAQAVKNIQTGTTGACRGLKGLFSLILTGTPVENHLGEYYSVMDIAVPGLLGEYEAFRRRMNGPAGPFLEMLIRRTRPFILRRTKKLISSELPPKIETDIFLDLSERQKALYTKTVAKVRQTVDDAYRSKSAGQARIIALTAILRLRQLCLSPEILLPETKSSSPKVEFLLEQLEELFDEGHSVLVFSQFTSFLDIVERALAARALAFMRLDGGTPVGARRKLVNAFQKSEAPCAFLLSLKAGGKGLNLTRATYVFHLDPWWNPAVEDQASDRAHRIGQVNQVTITRLVMRHTIEEKIMELKRRKLDLYKALLEDTAIGGISGIGREDFDFLLGQGETSEA